MKRILTLVFVLSSIMAYAQPVNDDCAGATAVTMVNGSGTFFGVTALATPTPTTVFNSVGLTPSTPTCLVGTPGAINDVYWKFNTGNFTDFEIEVDGAVTGAGVQFEVWRVLTFVPNFCTTGGTQFPVGNTPAEFCAAAAPTETSASIIVTALSTNTEYYIVVSSQTNTPFAAQGTISPYVPPICLDVATAGQTSNTNVGTLFDSGCDGGDYGPLENFEYTICPSDPHGCVVLDIQYVFEPSPAVDRLDVFLGNTIGLNQTPYATLCGQGSQTITFPDSCVTVRFRSDGTNNFSGFELNWSISNNCPPPVPVSDCYTATPVPQLPFTATNKSTCGAGNSYTAADACGSSYMEGEDLVFAYQSPGDECIKISLTNTGVGAGVFLMDGCPNADATQCIEQNEGQFGDPEIQSAYLEDPGTYYIVVSSSVLGCATCVSFNIAIQNVPCPLKVNTNITPDSLIQTIAAQGVVVQNAILDCPQGAYGIFEGGVGDNTDFLSDGIILSNGNANSAEGPSSKLGNSQLSSGGDSLLSVLAGIATNDKCILEFDVFAPTDELVFDYMFGSEEYNELVNNPFNAYDVFAFLISGPGITGEKNLAYIPNTTTPITVNTVNFTTNSAYYMNNTPSDPFGPAINEKILGYDGHTTILQAQTTVQACEWYHVKLMIADAFDRMFDSGVLIEANSLFGNIAAVASAGSSSQFDNTINAAEACADGAFIINLLAPQTTASDTVFIVFSEPGLGMAGFNIDYTINSNLVPGPDNNYMLIFPPGTTTDTIFILPIDDNDPNEGSETVTIYISSTCPSPYDSATIIIRDRLEVDLPTDTIICGNPILMPLVHNGADFSFWSPGVGLSDSTITNPVVSPDTITTYTVVASNGVCNDTVSIKVTPNIFEALGDTVICQGSNTQIISTTNITSGVSYAWTPSTGLSSATAGSPTVSNVPVGINEYVVTYTSPACVATDTVTIEVLGQPTPDAGADEVICEGEAVSLGYTAEAGMTYNWVNQTTGDTIEMISTLDITPTETTTYQLLANNGNCPTVSSSVTIGVEGEFELTSVPSDNEIIVGEQVSVTTNATPLGINPIGPLTYVWTPNITESGISNASIAEPTLVPTQTTVYTVSATSSAGCTDDVSFEIIVNIPNFNVPNAFTPDGDGSNDEFKILTAPGAIYDVVTFRVFNRWGNLVYNADGNSSAAWDGIIDGEKAASDTYVYHVVIRLNDGSEQEFQGEMLLIR
jgi:gliding motility-associated-like protein